MINRLTVSVLLCVMTCSACLAVDKGLQPAKLADTSDEALVKLSASVAEALGEGQVKLGPIDKGQATVLSILPPRSTPLEGNNPALPRSFQIYAQRGGCWLLETATSEYYQLKDMNCELINAE